MDILWLELYKNMNIDEGFLGIEKSKITQGKK